MHRSIVLAVRTAIWPDSSRSRWLDVLYKLTRWLPDSYGLFYVRAAIRPYGWYVEYVVAGYMAEVHQISIPPKYRVNRRGPHGQHVINSKGVLFSQGIWHYTTMSDRIREPTDYVLKVARKS